MIMFLMISKSVNFKHFMRRKPSLTGSCDNCYNQLDTVHESPEKKFSVTEVILQRRPVLKYFLLDTF